METEKPLGWRPHTDEQRERMRAIGFSEEAIAEAERDNTYRPDETAVLAFELARATIRVLRAKFGDEFAAAVRDEMLAHADELAAEGSAEGDVEAPIIRDLAGGEFFHRRDE